VPKKRGPERSAEDLRCERVQRLIDQALAKTGTPVSALLSGGARGGGGGGSSASERAARELIVGALVSTSFGDGVITAVRTAPVRGEDGMGSSGAADSTEAALYGTGEPLYEVSLTGWALTRGQHPKAVLRGDSLEVLKLESKASEGKGEVTGRHWSNRLYKVLLLHTFFFFLF